MREARRARTFDALILRAATFDVPCSMHAQFKSSTRDARRSMRDVQQSTIDARRLTLAGRLSSFDVRRSTLDSRRATLDARRGTAHDDRESRIATLN